MATPAHNCLLSMLTHVHFPYLVEFLVDRATSSKAEVLRSRATSYLKRIVSDPAWSHIPHFRDTNRFSELLNFIAAQTDDTKEGVRSEARQLAAAFVRAFPDASVQLWARVGVRARRLLATEAADIFGDQSEETGALRVDSRLKRKERSR
eukprot:372326_1